MAKKNYCSLLSSTKVYIEFADNGIIVRNPYNKDDVQVVLSDDSNYTKESMALGKKIFCKISQMMESPGFPIRGAKIEINIELTEIAI